MRRNLKYERYSFGFQEATKQTLTNWVNCTAACAAPGWANLFDSEYVATCGEGSCYYGDRRNVLASLRYNW